MASRHDRMYRDFGFFSLRVADGLAVGMGGMYRTTIQDHAVYAARVSPAIELLFILTFVKKTPMTNFYAIGKRGGERIKKLP